MFNIEQAISEWRQQMLDAGIQSPTPLDELESHLRDDVEHRMKLGQGEAEAFQAAAQKLGQAGSLKTEFARADGFLNWFGDNKNTRVNRVLGVLWMAQCLWFLATFIKTFYGAFPIQAVSSGLLFLIFFLWLYATGVRGSFYLFRGEERGRKIITVLALLGTAAFFVQIWKFQPLSWWGGILTLFNVISIWLLRTPGKAKLATD